MPGLSVPDDIVHRLLDNAKQGGFDCSREALPFISLQIDDQAMLLLTTSQVLPQGRNQP